MRARIARTTPWRQTDTPTGADRVDLPLADALAGSDASAVIGGTPWSGKSTVLAEVAGRLLMAGRPRESLGWVELAHPMWDGVTPAMLAEAHGPGVLFLDDLPLAHEEAVRSHRGPTRLLAAVARVGTDHDVGGVSFASYLRRGGLPLSVGEATSPAALVRCAFELSRLGGAASAPLRRYLWLGGFPGLLGAQEREPEPELALAQRALVTEVVERAVYRRIPRDFAVRDPRALEALLVRVAARPGAIVSAAALGKGLGLTQPTVDKYLALFERVGLLTLLPNWSADGRERRGRRAFFCDGAVRNAVLRRGLAPLVDPEEMGHLLFTSLIAHAVAWARRHGATCTHWRRGRDEVDLVLSHAEGTLALQIGLQSPVRGLSAFRRAEPRLDAGCWLVAHHAVPTWPANAEDGLGRLPLVPFLVALGVGIGD